MPLPTAADPTSIESQPLGGPKAPRSSSLVADSMRSGRTRDIGAMPAAHAALRP